MLYSLEECGRRIAKLRIQNNYTQERLSAALNLDRTHLSKIEAGTRSCSIDLLIQLSAFFDVSLDYIVFGKYTHHQTEELSEQLEDVISKLNRIREKL